MRHGATVFRLTHTERTYNKDAGAGNLKLYVNGELKDQTTRTGEINSSINPLQISQFTSTHNGTIDEVRIYNRALSPEEINASYNNGLHRLYHNFTDLYEGFYNYTAWAIDQGGNMNKTTRNVTIDLPPRYWDDSTNSTLAGMPVEFRLRWTDTIGLSGYVYSIDNCTGSFVNVTSGSLSGTEDWSNVTHVVNDTLGCTIRWKVYANDTSDRWNTSDEYSFITSGCGLYLNQDTNLINDITGCTGTILYINASDVTLDCQNHYLQTSGNYSINNTNHNNVTIKNCEINGSGHDSSYGIYYSNLFQTKNVMRP